MGQYRKPCDRCPRCAWATSIGESALAKSEGDTPGADALAEANGLALIAALRDFDKNAVWGLLAGPCNVNALDQRGVSALMVAAYRGFADVCQRLLDLGADARHYLEGQSIESAEGDDTWHGEDDRASTRARMSGDHVTIDVISRAELRACWSDALAVRDKDPAWFHYVGPEFLVNAAELGMTALCVEMIDSGVPVELPNGEGSDALRAAAGRGDIRTSLTLVAMGANPLAVGSEGLFSYDFMNAWDAEQHRLRGSRVSGSQMR